MKINDIKHNHSLTDLLKVILFALIMLAPIGSIAVRCLYVISNKNAYESYYGETINETIYTNAGNNFQEGKEYKIIGGSIPYTEQQEVILYVENVKSSLFSSTCNNIRIRSQNSQTYCLFYYDNTYIIDRSYTQSFEARFTFLYKNNVDLVNAYQTIYEINYNKYSYLDNVFEYSVNNIENESMYNWTQNTLVYTGINAMCTNLEIGISAIPIILTYWFIITIIYVIVDIVLKMFTTLTHLLSKKT